MSQTISFTKYEHIVHPKLRDQLNHSESVEDVKKFFVDTILEFFELATDGKLSVDYDDISLLPDKEPYYTLSDKVLNNPAYTELSNSDINAVMMRLAEQAAHHYQHISKNNSKTNLKIRNH